MPRPDRQCAMLQVAWRQVVLSLVLLAAAAHARNVWLLGVLTFKEAPYLSVPKRDGTITEWKLDIAAVAGGFDLGPGTLVAVSGPRDTTALTIKVQYFAHAPPESDPVPEGTTTGPRYYTATAANVNVTLPEPPSVAAAVDTCGLAAAAAQPQEAPTTTSQPPPHAA
ncbi:hypothetical protein HYH03_001844 [Edaphochlamys debaryana]|uniref:Uncharacterized protein n=1 Tax=Edaphochlamys debaryana TaxID=47281 RepID=A0A835YCU9_9CHLO|nr:hypothetical protein HYH03_001844 [Edaphochlamys debaryana]|eukprot:KAG2500266.1 hypothetical protein HYH03_001844 [Edaphochlamys debaryana]